MDEGQTTKGEQDGAANRSQPFSSQEESNVIGGWLPSLTFALGGIECRMKSSLLTAMILALCFGCGTRPTVRNESPPPSGLVGGYFGTEYKIYLTLIEDGSYIAGLGDCLGHGGTSDGKWQVAGKRVLFSPTAETTNMKGLLSNAAIFKDGEQWVLVPGYARENFKKHGPS